MSIKLRITVSCVIPVALWVTACASDDDPDILRGDSDVIASGFTSGASTGLTDPGPGSTAATDATATDAGETTGTQDSTSDPTLHPDTSGTPGTSDTPGTTEDPTSTTHVIDPTEGPLLGDGDLRGILTFSRYAADPLNESDFVGMAGAWRTADDELTEIEDFFGLWGLDTPYPMPPEELDALEHNGLLGGFDWGLALQWQLAGNAMTLVQSDLRAQACLLYLGGSPEVMIPGIDDPVPNFPIYAATQSPQQPEACRPSLDHWSGDTAYDLVLYGGELFATNVLPGAVQTPPVLEVTAPDFTIFQEPLSRDDDLTLVWSDNGNVGNRVIIRARDMFGRMFTVHAEDDGEYTIPAADLQELDVGPLTLMVAREHLELVPFTDGTVKVLTRYEQRGYFELI